RTALTLKVTNTRPKPVAAQSSLEFPGLRSTAPTFMPSRSAPYCPLVRSPGSLGVLCPGPVYAGSPSGCQSPHLGSSPEVVNSGQLCRYDSGPPLSIVRQTCCRPAYWKPRAVPICPPPAFCAAVVWLLFAAVAAGDWNCGKFEMGPQFV